MGWVESWDRGHPSLLPRLLYCMKIVPQSRNVNCQVTQNALREGEAQPPYLSCVRVISPTFYLYILLGILRLPSLPGYISPHRTLLVPHYHLESERRAW